MPYFNHGQGILAAVNQKIISDPPFLIFRRFSINHSQIVNRCLHAVLDGKIFVTHFRNQGGEHVFEGKGAVKFRLMIAYKSTSRSMTD